MARTVQPNVFKLGSEFIIAYCGSAKLQELNLRYIRLKAKGQYKGSFKDYMELHQIKFKVKAKEEVLKLST